MKYWEIIAENLKKAGWSWGYVSAVDREWRTIWIADAHRDGKRFVVCANEKLTAFLELKAAITLPTVTTRAAGFGAAIFAKQNTKKAEQENDHHVIKATKKITNAIPYFTRGCIGDGSLRADHRRLFVLYWDARA